MEYDTSNIDKLITLRDPLFQAVLEYSLHHNDLSLEASIENVHEQLIYCHICLDFVDATLSWTACATRSHFLRDASAEGYCYLCMKHYLISKIRDAQVSTLGFIACPCRECDVTINKVEVLKYVDEEWVSKYDNFVRQKQVCSDPLSRWCPRPSCDSVATVSADSFRASCPKCHLTFCAKCSAVHSPFLSCRMVKYINFKNYFHEYFVLFSFKIMRLCNGKYPLHKDVKDVQDVNYILKKSWM